MYIMLTSLALVFICGLFFESVFRKASLPGLLGMLAVGVILGPYTLNLLDESILAISAELRLLALVVILMKAGLTLNVSDLKKVGLSAVFMCFVPACFEICGMMLIAPKLLGISVLEAAIMGSVVAAVSPAVVVPRMVKLVEDGYGAKQGIPQLIMAGASADDVFVIVLFTSFVSTASGGNITALTYAKIPLSIIFGVVTGIFLSRILCAFFRKIRVRDSVKVVVLLSISFLLIELEKIIENIVPFSGLLAVIAIGAGLLKYYEVLAYRLSNKFSKLWVAAEIILFVLVGATVNVEFAFKAGGKAVALLLLVLCFRLVGVWVCLLFTKLTKQEKLFCMVAYIPKATVQAAIGGIPLAMGLPCGQVVLTVAVLSIIITAPLGAIGIDATYKKWLKQE